jgi:o-succinylbenzoate synthase
MQIKKVTIYQIQLQLKHPFVTSFGKIDNRKTLLIKLENKNGLCGWGESAHLELPLYTSEYLKGGELLIKKMAPKIINKELKHPSEIMNCFQDIKGNNISKAGMEMALWDLFARDRNLPLYKYIGSTKNYSKVGISIGIQQNSANMIEKIDHAYNLGYKRIKIKIKPGQDINIVKKIRETFEDMPLMVDANSAYKLKDKDMLKELDKFGLMMIEQPLGDSDLLDHSKLQNELDTPICLDESIKTYADSKAAHELNSCKIINIKPARLGGITETLKTHDFCLKNKTPLWIGGMLESGIGKAFLDHIATLPGFTLPGDNSPQSRYFEEDITEERMMLRGIIKLDNKPGIGVELLKDKLDKYTINKTIIKG